MHIKLHPNLFALCSTYRATKIFLLFKIYWKIENLINLVHVSFLSNLYFRKNLLPWIWVITGDNNFFTRYAHTLFQGPKNRTHNILSKKRLARPMELIFLLNCKFRYIVVIWLPGQRGNVPVSEQHVPGSVFWNKILLN